MVKNKSRLAIKLFVIVWVVLAVHIALKLTFNTWMPYVIPNERLQVISDFIDSNRWIEATLNGILYVFNGYVMICCGLQVWKLDKQKTILTLCLLVSGFVFSLITKNTTINTLILSLAYPLILNRKKWLYIILTFAITNIFMLLSLRLEGFVSSNDMQYICKVFLQFDYYIMLIINYFVFNLIRKE